VTASANSWAFDVWKSLAQKYSFGSRTSVQFCSRGYDFTLENWIIGDCFSLWKYMYRITSYQPNSLFNLVADIQRLIREEHQWINLLSTMSCLLSTCWRLACDQCLVSLFVFYMCILLLVNCVDLLHDHWIYFMIYFRYLCFATVSGVSIADTRCSEAWLLITDDGVHVTLGWSVLMGGYSIPDTAVKHRRRK